MSPKVRFSSVILLLVVSLCSGCGQPKITPSNLRLTMALRTAVSAQNKDWLARCREQVEERKTAGTLSAEEYDRFQEIITQADDGAWQAAEREIVRWQKAQRPTAAP